MKEISLKELLEAGCHFGHQVPKSHPKAREFVHSVRNGVQIIDLVKTKEGLEKAAAFVKMAVGEGGKIIFVGTKKQARSDVLEAARRCGAFYMVERWVGGLLTNWEEIKKNLKKMDELRENLKSDKWTKKEKVLMERHLKKLETVYGGIEGMAERPRLIYIVDVRREENAVREAQKTGVSIVGIVDTNTNPEPVDWPIPANDDAVGSIKLITDYMAEAVLEGQALAEKTATTEDTEGKRRALKKPVTTESTEKIADGTAKKQRKAVVAKKADER